MSTTSMTAMKAGSGRSVCAIGVMASVLVCMVGGVSALQAAPVPGFWTVRPTVAGENLFITAISADGNVAAGYGANLAKPFGTRARAFRWTREGGQVEIPGTGGNELRPEALDETGRTVVGHGLFADIEFPTIGWRQEGTSPAQSVPPIVGTTPASGSDRSSVSRDGRVMVANYSRHINQPDESTRSYRWTQETGAVELDDAGSGRSVISAVSGDGHVTVGFIGGITGAFWRDNGPVQILQNPAPTRSVDYSGNAVSFNGDYIAGSVSDGGSFSEWVVWERGSPRFLPRSSNVLASGVIGITDDGSLMALGGILLDEPGGPIRAPLIWKEGSGLFRFEQYLSSFGVAMEAGYKIESLEKMSPDGMTFVGSGRNSLGEYTGFIATVPSIGSVMVLFVGWFGAGRCRR